MNQTELENLSPHDKKIRLYLRQKKLLDDFLAHRAISQAQYNKSLGDLIEKMGLQEYAGK